MLNKLYSNYSLTQASASSLWLKSVASIITIFSVYLSMVVNLIKNDTPEPWTIGFQDGVSPGYTVLLNYMTTSFFI